MIGRLVLLAVAAAAAAGAAVFGRRRARQKARAQRRAERLATRARLGGAASAGSPAIAVEPSAVATAPPAASASESGPEAAPGGGGEARGQAAQLGSAFIAIRGIGPAMEERLRASGVTSVAQIAAWSDDDIEAIAPGLKVKAERIRREAWVDQAKAVMAGDHAAG